MSCDCSCLLVKRDLGNVVRIITFSSPLLPYTPAYGLSVGDQHCCFLPGFLFSLLFLFVLALEGLRVLGLAWCVCYTWRTGHLTVFITVFITILFASGLTRDSFPLWLEIHSQWAADVTCRIEPQCGKSKCAPSWFSTWAARRPDHLCSETESRTPTPPYQYLKSSTGFLCTFGSCPRCRIAGVNRTIPMNPICPPTANHPSALPPLAQLKKSQAHWTAFYIPKLITAWVSQFPLITLASTDYSLSIEEPD